MAVVRITADKRWYRRAAELVPDQRLKKELLRAVDRRGLTAEIYGDEVYLLRNALPRDERVLKAVEAYEASVERENARPRGVYRKPRRRGD